MTPWQTTMRSANGAVYTVFYGDIERDCAAAQKAWDNMSSDQRKMTIWGAIGCVVLGMLIVIALL